MAKTPAEKQKVIRDRRRAAGLCTACGQHKPISDQVKCISCSDKDQKYRDAHKLEKKLTHLSYYTKLKDDAFNAYGGYKCNCCGETIIEFLSLDHINGGGNQHRIKETGSRSGGGRTYLWLKRHNYPPGLQVLCMNCNFGRAMNHGICPHITNRVKGTSILIPANP